MRIELLGPLVVDGREGTAVVPAAKQRAMLAALALRAGHVVSFEDLAEAAWDDPPGTARVAVRNYVLRLRRALGPNGPRIVTKDPGYLLDARADDVDALAFDRLCDEGGSLVRLGAWDKAAETLRAGLEMWRGSPLADIPSQMLHDRWSPGLEEARLRALRDRIRADLQLGLHESVTGELRGLVEARPLDEQLWELLMLALYRSGRQVEALESYRQVRDVLVTDLGVEPGPDLRRLHQHILTQDPALDTPASAGPAARESPATVPRQLPHGVPGFVGRARELRLLDDSATGISAIAGTAGIGKTTLAVHFAHRVADQFPDGQLYVNLRGFHPIGEPVSPSQALRGFLVALGVPITQIPADPDAKVGLYRSLLAGKRVLVLLDNAENADQVRPLLPGSPGCLVLVTSRNQLASLSATDGARLLALDLLTEDEARGLIITRLGHQAVEAQPAAAAELIRLCARLPLALAVAVSRIAARPGRTLAELTADLRDGHDPLDTLDVGDAAASVRAVFSWSYRQLSEAAARMFRLLGVHPGPDITAAAAASLAGVTLEGARASLREMTMVGLLTEHEPGRYTFHDLLRQYASELADTTDRADDRDMAIRRMLDHYLHTANGLVGPEWRTLKLTSPEPGVVPEPVTRDGGYTWLETEHQILRRLTDVAGSGRHDGQAWRLVWSIHFFLDQRSYWRDWIAAHEVAFAAAQRLGDTEGLARAGHALGVVDIRLGRYAEALDHLEGSLESYRQLGDRIGEATVGMCIAGIFTSEQRYHEALAILNTALELVEDADDLYLRATAMNNIGYCHACLGDYREAVVWCEQALPLYQAQGDSQSEGHAWDSLGYAHSHLGNNARAVDCYQRARRLQSANPYESGRTSIALGDAYQAAGNAAAARQTWQEALTILTNLNHPEAADARARLESPGLARVPGQLKGGVGVENPVLHPAQLQSWLEAELTDQHAAGVPVSGQRVAGAAIAVQREHQQRVHRLAEQLDLGEALQFRQHRSMTAEVQIGIDPRLKRLRPKSHQVRNLGVCQRRAPDVFQRSAAPQRQRLAEPGGRDVPAMLACRLAAGHSQRLEPGHVQFVGRGLDEIPRPLGLDRGGAETAERLA